MTPYEEHLEKWEKEQVRRREMAWLMAATLYGGRTNDWEWSDLQSAAEEFYASVYHVQMPPIRGFIPQEEDAPPS
jgi:hypothetical protein